MAKIYQENQTTELYNSTGAPAIAREAQRVRGYARQMDEDAQRYENQARQTYSTALKIGASETMNELYSQYSDDPVRLQAEFKKAYDKAIGDIADDDVKVDFMANATLQSQTYITKAIENKKKKDYRIMKSTTFDGIDKNTQTLGLAFSTLLGDDFNPDNVGVYNIAVSNNNAMINRLNDDGTYMFTDEQRKRMRDDMDKAHLFALKTNFDDMLPYQKDSYMKLLADDNVEVPVGLDEEKNVIRKNLRDVVSPESYEKFKDYAEKVYERKQKILKKNGGISEEEADSVARQQQLNSELIDSVFDDITQLKKDKKATDRILTNLELLDNLQGMDVTKLSEKDKEKYEKKGREDLISALKNDSGAFDEWGFDSAMATAVQILKKDGKIVGGAWSDDMSVVMIRDFYAQAKESGLDLRANDSGSREAAKKLASKAISNTIEMVSGGYDQRDKFNSIYLYGRKVSKQPINKEEKLGYNNPDYIITGGKKRYNATGIEVDL